MIRVEDPSFRLRAHYTPPSLPAAPKVGLDLDKLDRPTLELADYIHRQLATPPAAICCEEPAPKPGDAGAQSLAATVAVNPRSLTECRIAIDEFAELNVGVALPATARGQSEWAVVGDPASDHDSKPGSWGGHGIRYREYDPETFKCETWDAQLLVTVSFHQEYVRVAHVVVTEEMLHKQGIGPSGVNWDELIADIKALPRQHDPCDSARAPRLGLA